MACSTFTFSFRTSSAAKEIGASIATYEGSHLTLEITEFLWRGRAKAWVGRLGSLVAALFCFLLSWLCLAYVRYQHGEWAASGGISAVFDGFPAPDPEGFRVGNGPRGANVRRVEPRNTPTMINAVFNRV